MRVRNNAPATNRALGGDNANFSGRLAGSLEGRLELVTRSTTARCRSTYSRRKDIHGWRVKGNVMHTTSMREINGKRERVNARAITL